MPRVSSGPPLTISESKPQHLGRGFARHPAWTGTAAAAVCLLLLAGAAWVLWQQRESMARSLSHIAQTAVWWQLAVLIAVPLVNLVLTAQIFWVLNARVMQRGAPLRWGEMVALIASGTLLNQVPGKPGVFGRLAYHKAVNGISLRDSALVVVVAVCAGGAGAAAALSLALAGVWHWSAGLAAAVAGLLSLWWVWRRRVGQLNAQAANIQPALDEPVAEKKVLGPGLVLASVTVALIRAVETVLWGLRYWVVFDLIDRPVTPSEALLLAAVSQVASVGPFQIGLREWVVGIAASWLPSAPDALAPSSDGQGGLLAAAASGLAADLICRATDLLVMVPLGVPATLWAMRRVVATRT